MDVAELLAGLTARLGPDAVLTGEQARREQSCDLLSEGGLCLAVVRPVGLAQLQEAVQLVAQTGLPITPRGGGLTYVSGYTLATGGHIAFDLRAMNRIIEINPTNMTITVEAGVTWAQIYEALRVLGLRLPFFGTFSGRGATVGGGLSNGALFLGTARYGTAADAVVGMTIVLADGGLMQTGQMAVKQARSAFFRSFGPDMTGLFTHDAGAFGIKAEATLRLIPMPEASDYLSFGFATQAQAVEAICAIGRSGLAEDAYVMDAAKTRAALSAPSNWAKDSATMLKVMRQESNPWAAIRAGFTLARAGRDFVEAGCHSLHLVLAGRHRAAVLADKAEARSILHAMGGRELPDSIPRAARAMMFSPLSDVVGPQGDRWLALNAKVAHGDALTLVEDAEALIARYQARLDEAGVMVSRLLTVIGTHVFSYEPVFNWRDAWLPMHHATLLASGGTHAQEPEPAPATRDLVMDLRAQIIALFAAHGAASNQIGRTYPYASVLHDGPRDLLLAIKQALDPQGRMNPGALEL